MSDMSREGGMSGRRGFQDQVNERGQKAQNGADDERGGVVLGRESSNGRMSEAYTIQILSRIMHWPMSLNALVSLAFVFSNYLDIELPDEAKKTESTILQWFSRNITLIEPLFDLIRLEYTQLDESSDNYTSGD